MVEYIERDVVLTVVEPAYRPHLARLICALPAADVAPVRHGKWIPVEGYTGVEAFGFKEEVVVAFQCTVCGKDVDVSEGWASYCPGCGAMMDQGEGAE